MKLNLKYSNFSMLILIAVLVLPFRTHAIHIEHERTILNATDSEKEKVINGKIIDAETKEVIPFCNIIINETNYVTSSNELGEFSVKLENLPATLIITHLSYATSEVTIVNEDDLLIGLRPLENQLNEVVLTNANSKRALEIVNKTIDKYNATNSNSKYGRSLYRQKSKNNDLFSEYAEIIYDIEFDNDGIIDWNIFEGRYALKKETINNKNFTLLTKILRVHQPNSDDLIFPLTEDFIKYYNIKIINFNSGNLATINFTPLDKVKSPIIEGNVLINTDSYEVVKFEGNVQNDDLKIVSLSDKDASKKNYKLNFEISYRDVDSIGLVIDYINLNHEFDYYKENKFLTHLFATSTLSFFEYFKEDPKTNKRKRFKYKSSDWDKLDIVGYNKAFWDNNPIVKRTNKDNEVIENFEKLRAFESIFINSENQITITGSDISNDPFIQKISGDIEAHHNKYNTQEVFLHTDASKYSKGNRIFYSAYVTSENKDLLFNEKDVLYVDLLKGRNIVESQVIKINHGRGHGTFSIKNHYGPGNFKIVAYTNFMKNFDANNFFTKDIQIYDSMNSKPNSIIVSKEDKTVIKFYPEGGNIINEVSNRIAYSANDSNGDFKNVEGKIIDSDGKFIATLKSKFEGLGFFYITPKRGKTYSIILNDNSRYSLPKAINSGYSIIVNNVNPRTMAVEIRSSEELKSNKIYVLGLMDNTKFYQGNFYFGGKDIIRFEIPKSKFSSGVMHLVLLDEAKKVYANRYVYINSDNNIKIETEIDKQYVNNEFIKLKVRTSNPSVSTSNISLSITELKSDDSKNIDDNLTAHFKLPLFSNDTRISKFIDKNDRVSSYKLDLMMLINTSFNTNWTKKVSEDIVKNYKSETGITIAGIAKDEKDNVLSDIKVKLLTKSKDRLWNYEAMTNKDGLFAIDNFAELDTTSLEFRTYDENNKQLFSKIELLKKDKTDYVDYLNFNNKININDPSIADDGFSNQGEVLEGVELKAVAATKTDRKSLFNITPDGVIEGENIYGGTNLFLALANIPGVKYVKDHYTKFGETLSIRNSFDPPLWLLDGVKINGPEMVNSNQIDRIEVLISLSKTAAFGPDGRNGVIAIYSKKGVNSKYVNDIIPSTFRQIIYNSPEKFKFINNNTLFWRPSITTDKNGLVEIFLKKPSADTEYINVNIQAINDYGEIGSYNEAIKIE